MFKEIKKSIQIAGTLRKLKNEDEVHKKKAANSLVALLKNERGPFFKLAQYLGTSPKAFEEIQNLAFREDCEIDLEWVQDFLSHQYQRPYDQIFQTISKQAKLASIGQVHRARLISGEEVALKIRLPDIEKEIKNQLKILGMSGLGNLSSVGRKWGVDFGSYAKSFELGINEEISYIHEVSNYQKFCPLEKEHFSVKIPKVFKEFCSDFVIVEEWIEGEELLSVCSHWSLEERRNLSKIILESYFLSLFKVGIIQCDFNHGNFLFQKDKEGTVSLVYLDFGNCLEISSSKRQALLKLILAAQKNDSIDPLAYLVELGFEKEKLLHIHAALPLLVKEIFDPFCSQYAFNLNEWKLSENMNKILGENKWWFRSAGPPEFLKMMQSYMGMINLLRKLETPLLWPRIFEGILSEEIVSNKAFHLEETGLEKYSFHAMASSINIVVLKDKKNLVDLKFPIRALVDLENYMDEEIKMRLKDKEIQISTIISESMAKGCLPGELFRLEDHGKLTIITLL